MFSTYTVNDFLTPEEVQYVKTTVHNMRDDWRHISTFPIAKETSIHAGYIDKSLIKSAENQYFLGDAIYVIDSLEQIDKKIQHKLSDKFSFLYEKILVEISKNFGEASYLDGYAKPGFHVFCGKQQAFPFQWHIDTTICMFDPKVDPNLIYSFLCCIETPKDRAGLEYVDTNDWNVVEQTLMKELEYDIGSLTFWRGNHIHRMRRFDMEEGESRITIQGHLYSSGSQCKVYW